MDLKSTIIPNNHFNFVVLSCGYNLFQVDVQLRAGTRVHHSFEVKTHLGLFTVITNRINIVDNNFTFSFYLQCLEQEKHMLRRKLSEAESERDLRVQELESDYNELRSKLMSQVIQLIEILLLSMNLVWLHSRLLNELRGFARRLFSPKRNFIPIKISL